MPQIKQRLILGGPGCGKTTRMLDIIEEELKAGVAPDEILFCSFTRKATREALERIFSRFNLKKADVPYFRTLHALAFKQLGIRTNEVMGSEHFDELGEHLGLSFSVFKDEFGLNLGGLDGDRIAFQEQMCRVTKKGINRAVVDNYWILKQYADTLFEYKKSNHLLDHTDIIHKFAVEGEIPNVKVVIVDEAQDLSPVQWDVVNRIKSHSTVERVFIAGDDDQAIYTWAGADIAHFLSLEGEKEVLPVSHRLPREIFNVANTISGRIKKRYAKEWRPRDEDGQARRETKLSYIDMDSDSTWLLLARSNYLLNPLKKHLLQQGVLFNMKGKPAFDKKDFATINQFNNMKKGNCVTRKVATEIMRNVLIQFKRPLAKDKETFSLEDLGLPAADWHRVFDMSNQEYYKNIKDFNAEAKVNISTIHSVKGGEADNVVLVQDIPPRTYKEMRDNPDDEHRVFYVAATRARQNLFVIDHKTKHAYKV